MKTEIKRKKGRNKKKNESAGGYLQVAGLLQPQHAVATELVSIDSTRPARDAEAPGG